MDELQSGKTYKLSIQVSDLLDLPVLVDVEQYDDPDITIERINETEFKVQYPEYSSQKTVTFYVSAYESENYSAKTNFQVLVKPVEQNKLFVFYSGPGCDTENCGPLQDLSCKSSEQDEGY